MLKRYSDFENALNIGTPYIWNNFNMYWNMNRIKIAVAEDHDKLRQILIFNLSLDDRFDVIIEAENGQILIDRLKEKTVDVVILDIRMPIMNGEETLIHLKNFYPEIKVVMYSSMGELLTVNKFKELGADSFVSKESDFNLLLDSIIQVHKPHEMKN